VNQNRNRRPLRAANRVRNRDVEFGARRTGFIPQYEVLSQRLTPCACGSRDSWLRLRCREQTW
jgi:hypothetical protein